MAAGHLTRTGQPLTAGHPSFCQASCKPVNILKATGRLRVTWHTLVLLLLPAAVLSGSVQPRTSELFYPDAMPRPRLQRPVSGSLPANRYQEDSSPEAENGLLLRCNPRSSAPCNASFVIAGKTQCPGIWRFH